MSRYKTPAITNRPARQIVPRRPALANALANGGRLPIAFLEAEPLAAKARRLRTTKTDVRMALRVWRNS